MMPATPATERWPPDPTLRCCDCYRYRRCCHYCCRCSPGGLFLPAQSVDCGPGGRVLLYNRNTFAPVRQTDTQGLHVPAGASEQTTPRFVSTVGRNLHGMRIHVRLQRPIFGLFSFATHHFHPQKVPRLLLDHLLVML